MRLLNALEAVWIVVVIVVTFFLWPALVFRQNDSSCGLRIARNLARTILCVTIAAIGLSRLGVFNPIAMFLLFAAAAILSWFLTAAKALEWKSFQRSMIGVVRQTENWSFAVRLLPRGRPRTFVSAYQPARPWPLLSGQPRASSCVLILVMLMIGIIAGQHAMHELRLEQPADYNALLQARAFTLSLHTGIRPLIFPAIIATTSLFSGRDEMQVTRYLSPLVNVFLALTVGSLIFLSTRSLLGTAVAMYCIGACAFPAPSSGVVLNESIQQKLSAILRTSPAEIPLDPEFALGIIFVLLGLVFVVDGFQHSRPWESLADFACCFVMTAFVSQFLLLILVGAAAAFLLRPWVGLIALVVVAYGSAIYRVLAQPHTFEDARFFLPPASAIGISALVVFIQSRFSVRWKRAAETALLAGFLVAALVWFRPHRAPEQCLEYEATARVTERIVHEFPHQTWAVAAPVEQLSETLGWGVHEDLAQFVNKYRSVVDSPQFRFPNQPQHLFVYVEKKPFQIFSTEPPVVNYALLADATYTGYRSPAGRASMEWAALALCESYRRRHSNVDIFFEDAQLRVYHIQSQATSNIQNQQD